MRSSFEFGQASKAKGPMAHHGTGVFWGSSPIEFGSQLVELEAWARRMKILKLA